MKKLISTIGLFLLINAYLSSQVSIDFCPKALTNEFKKISGDHKIELKELSFNNSLSNLKMGKFFYLPESCMVLGFKYVYIGRVQTCRAGGCSLYNDSPDQAKEFFDYYILYNEQATVQKIKVFNYQSSHGQEGTASSWLKQFKTYDGHNSLVVGKNIDALSGATISVDATVTDIEDKTKLLQKLLNGLAVQ